MLQVAQRLDMDVDDDQQDDDYHHSKWNDCLYSILLDMKMKMVQELKKNHPTYTNMT